MKKSFVVLLVLLALIVIVSPGIVGRLAEHSMDENLDWAATGSDEVLVTSMGFDRGWFSSAGRHRIDIRDPRLRELLLELSGAPDSTQVPAVLIDTRLDHGLIPVTSLARDNGSLLPGLGSAVSTLRLEYPNGETLDVPGTIFSRLGISGELESTYEVEPGSVALTAGKLDWGATSIVLGSNAGSGRLAVSGSIDPLAFESSDATVLLGRTRIAIEQRPGRFGLPIGDLEIFVDSLGIVEERDSATIGPISINTATTEQGERLSVAARLRLDNARLEPLGNGNVLTELRLEGADGATLANMQRSLERLVLAGADDVGTRLQADTRRLLAAGLDLDITRLDIELPAGVIRATGRMSIAASDPAAFSWAGMLLASDAALDLSLPAAVVNLITTLNPQANALIALGYLRREDDVYRLEAALGDGRVTINGAPMQLPLGAFR